MHNLYTTRVSSAKNNSIENQLERTHADLLLVGVAGNGETSALETLREKRKPGAIPVHELQVVATTIEDHEESTGEWILAQRRLDDPNESIERLAHVDRAPVREDPTGVAGEE